VLAYTASVTPSVLAFLPPNSRFIEKLVFLMSIKIKELQKMLKKRTTCQWFLMHSMGLQLITCLSGNFSNNWCTSFYLLIF
jgi:hypothetical protein